MSVTDMRLVVCEMRAEECLEALRGLVGLIQLVAPTLGPEHAKAVLHNHRYVEARLLLDDIEALRLPAKAFERLKEIDALRRAAEQMEDACDAT